MPSGSCPAISFRFLSAALAALLLGALSCGSGPENRRDTPPSSRASRPLATPAQSTGKALELERNAANTRSFSRIRWLEEAALEHQWLVDNHPGSPLTLNARDRIMEIRTEIGMLLEWKKKQDEFDRRSQAMMSRPAYLHEAEKAASELAASPYDFAAEFAIKRLEKLRDSAGKTVAHEFEKIAGRAAKASGEGDWKGAWAAFGAFDPDYASLFPDFGRRLDERREGISSSALAAAEVRLQQARVLAGRKDHHGALEIMLEIIDEFDGLPFHPEFVVAHESMADDARVWILSEREIPGSPAPAGIYRRPSQVDATGPEAVPGTARQREVDRILNDVVIEEVPAPDTMFEGSHDRLATADGWYYKAVALELRALPGDPGRKKLLAAAARSYSSCRAAYVHLLALNKKPDEALETRMALARKAAAWCKTLESTEDE